MMWQGNADCYIKEHNVIPTDDCSIMKFLSEVSLCQSNIEVPLAMSTAAKVVCGNSMTIMLEIMKIYTRSDVVLY